ncbi:hypothetical protein EDD16DRAFT_1650676, partial [Pisolithus croceorrhizus]
HICLVPHVDSWVTMVTIPMAPSYALATYLRICGLLASIPSILLIILWSPMYLATHG